MINQYLVITLLTNHSFFPKITLPTRLSNIHGTLIENFLCRLSETTLDTTSGILIKKLSDHQPYFTILNNINVKHHKPKNIKVTKQDNESKQQFHYEILHCLEHENLTNDITQDPNINYNILHNIVQNAKMKHIPQKSVRFHKYKHKIYAWITRGIIKSIHYKDDLYKKHKMTDPYSFEYDAPKNNLKTYNTILKKSICLSKKNYYEILFQKFQNDIKGTWKTINKILNRTKRKKSFPQFFRDGEHIATDLSIITNKFNIFL